LVVWPAATPRFSRALVRGPCHVARLCAAAAARQHASRQCHAARQPHGGSAASKRPYPLSHLAHCDQAPAAPPPDPAPRSARAPAGPVQRAARRSSGAALPGGLLRRLQGVAAAAARPPTAAGAASLRAPRRRPRPCFDPRARPPWLHACGGRRSGAMPLPVAQQGLERVIGRCLHLRWNPAESAQPL
jgi:hypothetical protein